MVETDKKTWIQNSKVEATSCALLSFPWLFWNPGLMWPSPLVPPPSLPICVLHTWLLSDSSQGEDRNSICPACNLLANPDKWRGSRRRQKLLSKMKFYMIRTFTYSFCLPDSFIYHPSSPIFIWYLWSIQNDPYTVVGAEDAVGTEHSLLLEEAPVLVGDYFFHFPLGFLFVSPSLYLFSTPVLPSFEFFALFCY